MVEARSLEELEAFTPEQLAMYGLVIRERILGPAHRASIRGICRSGSIHWEERGIGDHCVELWAHGLDLAIGRVQPYHDWTQSIFTKFSHYYTALLQEHDKAETDKKTESVNEMLFLLYRMVLNLFVIFFD